MTKATYEFEYAMKRLKDAIDYAQETGHFVEARLWSLHVEASYNADIKAEQELTANANAGAKLMHSLATGGETSVLSRMDNGVDAVDAQRWQDEQPNKTVDVTKYFNGYKATATKEWAKRHLNEVHNDYNKFLEEKANE